VNLGDWAGMAATSFIAGLLQAANGFGFAVLAVPLFLLFAEPGPAVQLVVIVTLALSAVVLPGMRDAVDGSLLLRLGLGGLAGLPLGLVAFGYADPVIVRAVIGITILVFAGAIIATQPWCRPAEDSADSGEPRSTRSTPYFLISSGDTGSRGPVQRSASGSRDFK